MTARARADVAEPAGATYKAFPPGWRLLRVPTSSTASALAGLALYSACRPRARAAQRAAWLAVRLFGPRALPGAALPWTPAADAEVWAALRERWARELGAFDTIAGYRRAQSDRAGAAVLLLRHGRPVAFVKLRPDDGGELAREEHAMRLVRHYGPRTFNVPEPIARGVEGGTVYLAATPLPAGLHYPPPSPPIREIADEVSDALGPLARPRDVPQEWTPMHGDLTPWNLRLAGGHTYLLDWENATWAPPYADEVLYVAVRAALGGRRPATLTWRVEHAGALRYWRGRLASGGWGGGAGDDRLVAAVARLLEREAPES